jgi:hypothetical protein
MVELPESGSGRDGGWSKGDTGTESEGDLAVEFPGSELIELPAGVVKLLGPNLLPPAGGNFTEFPEDGAWAAGLFILPESVMGTSGIELPNRSDPLSILFKISEEPASKLGFEAASESELLVESSEKSSTSSFAHRVVVANIQARRNVISRNIVLIGLLAGYPTHAQQSQPAPDPQSLLSLF